MTPKEAVNEIKLIVDTIDENLLKGYGWGVK